MSVIDDKKQEKAVGGKPRKMVTNYKMIKNYVGNLSVLLEAHDFSTPARRISFNHDEEVKHIPVKWAIGTFVSDSAMKQLAKGYFTFEKLDELIEMAEDMGYYIPETIKQPEVTLKDIRQAMKKNDLKALKAIIPNASHKDKADIVAIAQNLYGKTNMEIITYIEQELKVSVKPIILE